MPKSPRYVLIWSHEQEQYGLQTPEQPVQWFHPGDEAAFARWLEAHTSFAFVGQAGRLSVLKEARPRGSGYWYAYQKQGRQTRKRYLGRSNQVTFARLEQEAQILTNQPELSSFAPEPGTPPSEAQGMLLSSKLSPPRLPHALVERTRLLADLAAMGSYPFTLVSAAAGSGKTTLLATWVAFQKAQANSGRAQGADQAVAWLSLEELDDDQIRFWDLVIAALREACPTLGKTALALLHSPQPLPFSTMVTAFLHDLERVTQDIILILDDYHVISDQAICDSLLFLLDHAPASLHLVLGSRTDPDLPLARFRVRGQVLEIRDQDLRFTDVEAAHFLREAMGLPLSEDEVARLSLRTEGWIAGLQLAALSLRKRSDSAAFVKDFTGTHRYLLDYVQQDILAPLPQSLQDFLLQTSIVSRMNAALCQAITTGTNTSESQEMLQTLERANLFLVPLDEHRQWYRYHDLFREALLARLHASSPHLVPPLHRRAASFYEAQGEWREAITHALAAGDSSLAASLMEKASRPFWFRGEVRTIHTWVFSLPDADLSAHLPLALDAALRFFDAMNLSNETLYLAVAAQIEHTFTRVEGLLEAASHWKFTEAELALTRQRVRLLHTLIELREMLARDDAERLRDLILELEALPEDEGASWNMIPLYLIFWLTTVYQGYGVALIPKLRMVKQQLLQAGDILMATRVLSWLSFVSSAYATQLHQGQHDALYALALAEQIGAHTPWEGYLSYCLFGICYAWNKLDEASHWLQQLRHFARDWQHLQLLVEGETLAVQLGLARGDVVAAHEALHRLEGLLEQETFAHHAPWVTVLRVKIWLAEGKLGEASAWAAHTTFSPESWSPLRRWEFLILVRVLLAQQQYQQAVEMLARFSQYLDQEGSIDTVLEFRALSVVALHHAGKLEQAARVAAHLFAITEPQGHLRVYLDEGILMHQALSALQASAHPGKDEAPAEDEPGSATVVISRTYVLRLLAVFEQEALPRKGASHPSLPQATPVLPVPGRVASASPAPVEPLTRRELEVLRLLAEGASNQQIAAVLVIQLSTVKKHVGSLLAKLGAESRTQALVKARAFSLL
ncbi:LuxR C-terminal-related transcriptional regulator [Ktedonobacter racemifer]|uniref:ATP-dependent transcriptional regulator, MalT-like, LuxR family n=1 Tax=Ktedonobacter racemifer DSM 44963 TaxID=485913 RepID=D6U677_KTERA|nr:LuxR C-terminal-related transcriptional regulator [Ktedonobacter racemifer]EFH80488.1 ATP-dependent transcriptional regulator, MalT-like, LuxR family [Ktedonobacter racemifer DSM 44963]